MAAIQTHQDLQNTIKDLEEKQIQDKEQMKKYFHELHEDIRPINIIKNIAHEVNSSEVIKKDMIKAAVALTVGYLTKKIIQNILKRRNTPLSSGLQTIIQLIVSGIVAKNGTLFKNIALHFFQFILNKTQKQLSLPQHKTSNTINI